MRLLQDNFLNFLTIKKCHKTFILCLDFDINSQLTEKVGVVVILSIEHKSDLSIFANVVKHEKMDDVSGV